MPRHPAARPAHRRSRRRGGRRLRRTALSGARVVIALVGVVVLLSLALVALRRDWQSRHPRPAPPVQAPAAAPAG